MTRSPYLVSLIVASALSTGVLLPFSCARAADGFDGVGASGDEPEPPGVQGTNDPCVDVACVEAGARTDDCAPLVARTCGGCADSASCEAATLLSRYEPERCTAALVDEQKFPTCTARPCDALMTRVCGGTTPTAECASNPGCDPARVLYERSTSPSSTTAAIQQADASCAAALTDDAVFAPCGG